MASPPPSAEENEIKSDDFSLVSDFPELAEIQRFIQVPSPSPPLSQMTLDEFCAPLIRTATDTPTPPSTDSEFVDIPTPIDDTLSDSKSEEGEVLPVPQLWEVIVRTMEECKNVADAVNLCSASLTTIHSDLERCFPIEPMVISSVSQTGFKRLE